jgi:hypothetical protein
MGKKQTTQTQAKSTPIAVRLYDGYGLLIAKIELVVPIEAQEMIMAQVEFLPPDSALAMTQKFRDAGKPYAAATAAYAKRAHKRKPIAKRRR